MTTINLIKSFANGATSGHTSKSPYYGDIYVASIIDDILFSYRTPIAKRTNEGIILNKRKYSSTTSKLQNYIRTYTNVIDEVDEISL